MQAVGRQFQGFKLRRTLQMDDGDIDLARTLLLCLRQRMAGRVLAMLSPTGGRSGGTRKCPWRTLSGLDQPLARQICRQTPVDSAVPASCLYQNLPGALSCRS